MKQGWDIKKLKDVTSLITDGDWIESRHQSEDGIRLIQTGNVGNGFFKAKDDKPHFISEGTFDILGCTEIFEGDCLVSRLPDPVGRACLIPEMDCRMITAVDCSIIRFNEILVPDFFVYYSQSSKYQNEISNKTTGTTRKRVSRKNLEMIPIPVPPIAEQEKIVAELDCLSGIIEKKKQQLKELDNLAQSIFYEMFVPESKNWEKMKLIDIYKFIDYRGKTPTKILEGIPLITARNIRRGYIDYSVKEYISEEEFAGRQSRGIAQKGDLLFTTEAPMGYVAIADLEVFSTGQRLITFQKKHTIDVNNTYVLHYLLSDEFQMELNNQATGATVKGIKGSKLEQMLIDCPPMQLQKDFASKIEVIEKQKELIAQSIKETETLFNSHMDYYFN